MSQQAQPQESRTDEVERVRSYLVSQAAKRTPTQIVEALKEAQEQFVQATMTIPEALFDTPPLPGEWSGAQVLAHVIEIADYDIKTIVKVLHSGQGEDASAAEHYQTRTITSRQAGLDELASLREELITAALATNPDAYPNVVAWTHPEFGGLKWREALLFARVHTLDHARQMATIASRFAEQK